uniref:c-type cytochrome biogenesis protein CcmI n=1 Tax=Diaphorobacter aerolatus TaxID=1288495 RepID=UPI001D005B3C|nr:c-type cytochrome biogenesis protein CcmI [Diaphorobacter aerolatus]
MTMMHWLWLGAIVLLLLCLAVLLPPLLREAATQPPLRDEQTLRALYQGQRAELEQERARGNLGDGEYAQAVDELHRRLLLELDRRPLASTWQRSPWLLRGSALALAVLLPTVSLALYQKVGDPRAAAQLLAQSSSGDDAHGDGIGQGQIQAMVDGLAERLKADPQNLGGWVMLARSYETLERFGDAANAYQQAFKEAQRSNAPASAQAQLLADQADAQASLQDGDLEGAAGASIAQALQLDAAQPKALALAGAAAARRGEYATAQRHWQTLLAQLEPGSEIALRVQDDLLQLENLDSPAPVSAPNAKPPSRPEPAAPPARLALSGQLTLQQGAADIPALPSTARIYVVVRAANRPLRWPCCACLHPDCPPAFTSVRISFWTLRSRSRPTCACNYRHASRATARPCLSPATSTARPSR